jgi:tetratricopeptide (TPR) repeat protein
VTRHPWRRLAALLLVAGAAAGTAACGDAEDARLRGDRLWADSNYTGALSEYRLALRQAGGDEEILARVAHGYIRTGQAERARESYERLLARAPEYADQAVFDYLTLARRAARRGDRYGMAAAADAALALRPGLALPDLAAPLARYFAASGEPERALAFYDRALAVAPADTMTELLFEVGLVHEARGNCQEAIGYFHDFERRLAAGRGAITVGEREPAARVAARANRLAEARWHRGSCALRLARGHHQEGRLTEALQLYELVVELGVPENLQEQAWYERGEILFALGQFDAALESYLRVLELTPARTGQLVERTQRRIDQIRFGF